MKNLFFPILITAALFAAVSCQKEAPSEDPESAVKEEHSAILKNPVTITFELNSELTKTTWGGISGKPTWQEADAIKIIWGEGGVEDTDYKVATVNVDDPEHPKISVEVEESDNYYAVYPASVAHVLSEGELEITIPRSQRGSFADANIMVAKTPKTGEGSGRLSFKSMTHIMKFTLPKDAAYNRFCFVSNKNGAQLSGKVYTSFVEDEQGELVYGTRGTGDNNKYVDTSLDLDVSKETNYYIAVVPGADMSLGFGFKAEATGESGWSAGSLSSTGISPEKMARTIITNLGNIASYIRKKWYIKATSEGKGDGSDWDNAADVTTLVQLLQPKSGEEAIGSMAASWRLYDTDIYVAAGEYDLQTNNGGSYLAPNWGQSNVTRIHGGYSSTASVENPGEQNRDSNPTVFLCKETSNTDRMFRFQNTTIYDLTFDGITFKNNGTSATARGQVMLMDGSTSGKLTFNNCSFKDMVTSNSYGAPCIDIDGVTGSLIINFSGCEFKGNKCTGNSSHRGGVIHMENSSNTTLRFNQCVFDGNEAKTIAALSIMSGHVYMNRCLIKNSVATLSSNGGDNFYPKTIYLSVSGELCMNNCIIVNSSSPNFTTNGGHPSIAINGTATEKCFLLLNSTIYDSGLKLINIGNTSGHAVNSIFRTTSTAGVPSGEAWDRTTQKLHTQKYNLTRPYSGETSVPETNTDYVKKSNLEISWEDDTNTLTWTLSNVTHTHTNKKDVGDWVSANFSAFDTWLKTVESDPYGIFIDGTERSEYKPGA